MNRKEEAHGRAHIERCGEEEQSRTNQIQTGAAEGGPQNRFGESSEPVNGGRNSAGVGSGRRQRAPAKRANSTNITGSTKVRISKKLEEMVTTKRIWNPTHT